VCILYLYHTEVFAPMFVAGVYFVIGPREPAAPGKFRSGGEVRFKKVRVDEGLGVK
jgi:hypothetical protein